MSAADQACAEPFATTLAETGQPKRAGWRLPKWLVDRFRRLETRYQLSLMSTRQLADIGIDPHDIAGGVERKLAEQQLEDAARHSRRALR